MEDDLNFFENGRRPQYFCKWKTTSIFFENIRRPQFVEMGRRPHFQKMEDCLKKFKQKIMFKNSNNGCGTAPGNLVNMFYGG